MNNMTRILSGALCLYAAGCLSAPAAFGAPAVPAPGESLGPEEEKAAAEIENTTPAAESAPRTGLHFTLKRILVEQPDTDCPKEPLEAIAAKAAGHEITVRDLDNVLTELSNYCRQHGYPAAYAYVPEQKARGGTLVLRIAPGRYGRILVENHSKPSDGERAEGLAAGLRSGDIIRSKSLETALYNINELHGIQAAGILSPGETEGTSDLTIRLNPGKSATATLYTENYGSKSSGRYRYGLQASLLGVGTTGGRLTAGTLISNNSLHNYNVGWDMPVGHSGTNLGIRFSRMDYELGSMFSQLGAEGIANTLSLYGTTPLWRTARNTALLTYGYDYRKLTDRYRLFGISMKKHSHVFHAGLDGMLRNGTTSALHYNFTVYRGTLSADSDWAETMGQASSTLGGFTKGVMDLTGVQSVGGPFDVLLKFQGQLASRNLDGSERIYLGGAQGVRAYPQGEGSGDQGCLGTVELRYHTPVQGLTLSTYFDAGHVSRSKDGTAGNDTLKGWGIGVTYQHPDNYFARLDYARRIGAPEIMSNDAKSKQRMWFMMGKTW